MDIYIAKQTHESYLTQNIELLQRCESYHRDEGYDDFQQSFWSRCKVVAESRRWEAEQMYELRMGGLMERLNFQLGMVEDLTKELAKIGQEGEENGYMDVMSVSLGSLLCLSGGPMVLRED